MAYKISIYTRNFNNDPSSYYGITQSIRLIRNYVIARRNIVPDRVFNFSNKRFFKTAFGSKLRLLLLAAISWNRLFVFFCHDMFRFKPDIIVVNRDVFPKFRPIILFGLYTRLLRKSKVIWRFDDNIFESGEITKNESQVLFEASKIIITNNIYLRSIIPERYKNKLAARESRAMADGDLDSQVVRESLINKHLSFQNEFRAIWLGSASGMKYLRTIIPFLDDAAKILQAHKKAMVLYVVSDEPLKIKANYLIIKNIKWSRISAVNALYLAHVGLMPLTDTPFTRGKSAFKITQYKCAGIPSIASDLPAHREKLASGDGIIVDRINEQAGWQKAIISLALDEKLWLKMSQLALEDVEKNHVSAKSRADSYVSIFKEIDNE